MTKTFSGLLRGVYRDLFIKGSKEGLRVYFYLYVVIRNRIGNNDPGTPSTTKVNYQFLNVTQVVTNDFRRTIFRPGIRGYSSKELSP